VLLFNLLNSYQRSTETRFVAGACLPSVYSRLNLDLLIIYLFRIKKKNLAGFYANKVLSVIATVIYFSGTATGLSSGFLVFREAASTIIRAFLYALKKSGSFDSHGFTKTLFLNRRTPFNNFRISFPDFRTVLIQYWREF